MKAHSPDWLTMSWNRTILTHTLTWTGRAQEASTLHWEQQASKKCWQMKKWSSTFKSTHPIALVSTEHLHTSIIIQTDKIFLKMLCKSLSEFKQPHQNLQAVATFFLIFWAFNYHFCCLTKTNFSFSFEFCLLDINTISYILIILTLKWTSFWTTII